MMEQTKIYTALKGVRGRKPVDLDALEQLMVRFSQLVVEQRWIKEIDINPLLASPERLLALDARVVVHRPAWTKPSCQPLAIRPYPTQYVSRGRRATAQAILIRPIRPEDEPLMVKFHETLSDRTVYLRYLRPILIEPAWRTNGWRASATATTTARSPSPSSWTPSTQQTARSWARRA